MRRVLATPGILFFLMGEGCCAAITFFRWLGGINDGEPMRITGGGV